LFAVIVLAAGTASQAGLVSYIAIDLHPSGFDSSWAWGISGTQQVGNSGIRGITHALL